jgi:hypothetical protein
MTVLPRSLAILLIATLPVLAFGCGDSTPERSAEDWSHQTTKPRAEARKLSHEETLSWITAQRAWRPARKTRPIWSRPVAPEEAGREFQTADHVKEVAREGAWLCVGIAGEPWFQSLAKIEEKYDLAGEETRSFEFDGAPRHYRLFNPKPTSRNWAAQVKGPGIEGFYIKPGYDADRPLYSPVGGYVVRGESEDPYKRKPDDVWLVQEPLFESTYELIPDLETKKSSVR